MWDYFLHLQNRPFEHVKNAPDNIFSKYPIHKSETLHPMFLNCLDMDIGNCIKNMMKSWWYIFKRKTNFVQIHPGYVVVWGDFERCWHNFITQKD